MNQDRRSFIKRLESAVRRVSMSLSNIFDRLIYSKSSLLLVSLGITLLIFLSVISSQRLANQINSSTELRARVEVQGDLDEYEISDIPETVNVVVTGSALDVRTIQNASNYSAVINITNLSEGNHRVRFEQKGFSPSLRVIFQPDYIDINISRKTSGTFDVIPSFMNMDKLEEQYILTQTNLDVKEVTIHTSQEKLSQIAEVRALIDVSNKTESFNAVVKVRAYDQNGSAMDVDIEPEEINVSVSVSSS